MREAAVVIDMMGEAAYWHLPDDRTAGGLPDSHDFWMVLWNNRDDISGIAHSHPNGFVGPSHTDITTFDAVERGLGQRLDWWILAGRILLHCHWVGPGKLSYESLPVEQRPSWVALLCEVSQT